MDRLHTQKVTGTGAAVTITPGFAPSYIRVINIEGLCTLDYTVAMGAGKGYKILTGINATADTVSLHSLIASGGITVDTDGVSFTIGADTDINVNGEDLIVISFR